MIVPISEYKGTESLSHITVLCKDCNQIWDVFLSDPDPTSCKRCGESITRDEVIKCWNRRKDTNED